MARQGQGWTHNLEAIAIALAVVVVGVVFAVRYFAGY